jgi:uncharacterized protein DUF6688
MSLEPVSDENVTKTAPLTLPFPNAAWLRVLYGLFVGLMPVFSFWATDLIKPEWQNGNLGSYMILLLFPQASMWFFPLLAYSVICYLVLLSVPTLFPQSFIVRFGIYTGVLLALHYSSVVLIYALDSYVYLLIPVWIFPFVYALIYRWAVSRWTTHNVNSVLFLLIIGILLIGTLMTRGSLPVLVLAILTMAAPFWSFLLALRAAIWLYKNYETKLTPPRGLGLTAWVGAYIAAWRFDILKMYELYAALPPQPPPDCYIATAAARGHPRFVGSRTILRADGNSMQVNEQLQRLKCAELALLALHPRWHKWLRKVYDKLGKPLAHRIQNPFLADIAYLLLKPAEWLASSMVKIIVPEIESIAGEIYTK